jgi:hypothetical protein
MRDSHDFDETPIDPAPCYATAEEIALAERLRRKIEERYLASDNGHGGAPHSALPLAA